MDVSKEGADLANFIKSTHKSLREIVKENGSNVEDIWKSHIQNRKHLEKYAVAMHTLATKHWECKDNKSRVTWIYEAIQNYFHHGGMQQKMDKESRKVSFIGNEEQTQFNNMKSKFGVQKKGAPLTVLDVGSCYNPFGKYEDLEVTAIDLCPANADVKECDFLSLQVKEEKEVCNQDKRELELCNQNNEDETELDLCNQNNEDERELELCNQNNKDLTELGQCEHKENMKKRIHEEKETNNRKRSKIKEEKNLHEQIYELSACSFDVIIFSLFLEYLPTSRLRYKCCERAYKLLKPNGILCLITPDSKHQNANVHLYKLWKITLGYLGFDRIKYEKFQHFHGMIFRRGFVISVWESDSERELKIIRKKKVQSKFQNIDYDSVHNCIYIPQDLQEPL